MFYSNVFTISLFASISLANPIALRDVTDHTSHRRRDVIAAAKINRGRANVKRQSMTYSVPSLTRVLPTEMPSILPSTSIGSASSFASSAASSIRSTPKIASEPATTTSTRLSSTPPVKSLLTSPTQAVGGCSQFYQVKAGDICDSTGVPFSRLQELNPTINSDCSNLQIDQILCVQRGNPITPVSSAPAPTPSPAPACPEFTTGLPGSCDCGGHAQYDPKNNVCVPFGVTSFNYTVLAGDTCDEIDRKNGVPSFSRLRFLNPSINSDCTNLQIDQILVIGPN